VPVVDTRRLRNQPSLIQRIDNLLRKRPLLNILQIALKLRIAGDTNNNTIIATILDVQIRVVEDPSESRFEQRQVVLFNDGLDDAQGFESGVLEVSLAVGTSTCAFGVTEAAAFGHVGGLVFAAEQAAGYGVVDHDVQAVAATGGDELGFDITSNGVVLWKKLGDWT
jgi:hypothetical protein